MLATLKRRNSAMRQGIVFTCGRLATSHSAANHKKTLLAAKEGSLRKDNIPLPQD
jgi:hypothetical protein